jgi:hypothetical protein
MAAVVLLGTGCGGSQGPSAPSGTVTSDTIPVSYQVLGFTDDGAAVELDDGSVWAVAPRDQPIVTAHWNLDSQLVSIRNGGHTLFDEESGGAHSINARRIGTLQSHNADPHTGDNTVNGIGHGAYFAGGSDGSLLTLGDGSVWAVTDANDQQIDVQWADGDNVVVRKSANGGYRLDDTDVGTTISAAYIGHE